MYKTLYTREYQQMLALLRAKRADAQVSQVELARRLAWTQADVSKCETGVRRLDVIELRIWLKALGYELADGPEDDDQENRRKRGEDEHRASVQFRRDGV